MTTPPATHASAAPLSYASAGPSSPSLGGRQRGLVLAAAFLAWMFAGLELSMFVIAGDAAIIDLLTDRAGGGGPPERKLVGSWFTWYQGFIMLGAAAGGWGFGWLGDRFGRTRAMGWSVLCYSVATGLSYFVTDAQQLLVLRFLVGMGIGGVWPNAVSLVAEAWPNASRPFLAGLLGTAANVGFVILGMIGYVWVITADSWRWVPLVGTVPLAFGLFVLAVVPESPKWLASRLGEGKAPAKPQPAGVGVLDYGTIAPSGPTNPLREVFSRPLLRRTVLGILLGAIPVIGTSANGNWAVFWSGQVNRAGDETPAQAARRKAVAQLQRSGGATVGSLLGGWIACLAGRRLTYFLISLFSFATSSYLFGRLDPTHPHFGYLLTLLGVVGVTYFGWLPLYLPELVPTRVRSTGTGVSFNSGRVIAAVVVLVGSGTLITLFGGDFAKVGLWTGLVYALGMLIICFAPDTGGKKLED